jgi:predicted dehydrogenase
LQRSIEPAYAAAFQSFVDAIIDDQPVQVNLDDGYRSLVVIHAAEESARIRRPVAISEIDGSVMAASDG